MAPLRWVVPRKKIVLEVEQGATPVESAVEKWDHEGEEDVARAEIDVHGCGKQSISEKSRAGATLEVSGPGI